MASDSDALDAYSEVVVNAAKRVGPAVVLIETNRAQRSLNPYANERVVSGLGSGFVYDARGFILTNAHVVADSSSITAHFVNGDQENATLVRADRGEDLAVIRVNTSRQLPVAELSNDVVQPGQLVIAIGNPIGLGWSVTAGVVSAVGRNLPAQDGVSLRNVIQTQTPINPGNSGGPLVNGRGKVVGITTAVLTNLQGIGFVIPVDNILSFLQHAQDSRPANRVSMGVSVVSLSFDPRLAQALPSHQSGGVMIVEVLSGGAADRAGLKPRDVILAAEGQVVQDARDLTRLVQRHRPGDQLPIAFLREDKMRQVTLVLG